MRHTIKYLLEDATRQLKPSSLTPDVDAEFLLTHLLQVERSFLFTHPEFELNPQQYQAFQQLLQRRLRGEPVAYITGERGFWTLMLKVTPDVLIPRPESELLVEQVLAKLPKDSPCYVADLGTGSGAVALALASERPNWLIYAVDNNAAALAVAKGNAKLNHFANVVFLEGDWCRPLPSAMHAIVANPPYIRESDPHLQQGDVSFEPREALIAGPDGLDAIREIIQQAPHRLLPGGWLLLEHGFDQGEAVKELLSKTGFSEVSDLRDLAGNNRVAVARKDRSV